MPRLMCKNPLQREGAHKYGVQRLTSTFLNQCREHFPLQIFEMRDPLCVSCRSHLSKEIRQKEGRTSPTSEDSDSNNQDEDFLEDTEPRDESQTEGSPPINQLNDGLQTSTHSGSTDDAETFNAGSSVPAGSVISGISSVPASEIERGRNLVILKKTHGIKFKSSTAMTRRPMCSNLFGLHKKKKSCKSVGPLSIKCYNYILQYFPHINLGSHSPDLKVCVTCRCHLAAVRKMKEAEEEAKLSTEDHDYEPPEAVNDQNDINATAAITENDNEEISDQADSDEEGDEKDAGAWLHGGFESGSDDNPGENNSSVTDKVSKKIVPTSDIGVKITRNPVVEAAVARLLAQTHNASSVPSPSTSAEKCFICGTEDIASDDQPYQLYKRQIRLYKNLSLKPDFLSTISSSLFQEIQKPQNCLSCALCLSEIKLIWDLHQQVCLMQKNIRQVIGRGRNRIQLQNVKQEDYESDDIDQDMHSLESQDFCGNRSEEMCYYETEEEPYDEEDTKLFESPVSGENFNDQYDSCNIIAGGKASVSSASVRASKLKARDSLRKVLANNKPYSDPESESEPDMEENDDNDEDYVDDSDEVVCPHCGVTCSDRRNFLKHIGKVHKSLYDTQIVCEECGRQFSNQSKLTYHKETVHNPNAEVFSCEECSRTFYEKRKLFIHKVTVCKLPVDQDEVDLYKIQFLNCDQCDVKFIKQEQLTRHKLIHMDKEERPKFQCSKCGKSFLNARYQKNHERFACGIEDDPELKRKWDECKQKKEMYRQKLPFKCPKCPRKYAKEKSLKHHVIICKKPAKKKPNDSAFCDICGKLCTTKNYLAEHISRVHNKEMHVTCEREGCGRRFFDKYSLEKHVKNIHEKDPTIVKTKDFQCNLCQKKFFSNYDLKQHTSRVHLGLKRFRCSVCSREFFNKDTFKRHAKIHEKDAIPLDQVTAYRINI